ncbi:MAG: hypothetical protein FJX76_15605 [Armatimonadetes bacterium]|nr:hypothetical protein [Armatimonadota bacterium]
MTNPDWRDIAPEELTTVRTRLLPLALLLMVLVASAPAAAFDLFGLFAKRVDGICSAVNPGFVSVLDNNKQQHVFVINTGYVVPPACTPGRRIRVEYKNRNDGMKVVTKIEVLEN